MKYLPFLLVALSFFSCSSNEDPKQVALDYLNARNQMEWEKAKKFATPATDTSIDRMISISSIVGDSVNALRKSTKVNIIGEAEIDGNTAIVKAVNVIGGHKTEEVITLYKTGDGWLVNDPWEFSPSMYNVPEEPEDSTSNEETVQINPDKPARE